MKEINMFKTILKISFSYLAMKNGLQFSFDSRLIKGITWKCRDITRSTIILVTRMIMMLSWPNLTTTPLIDWTRRKTLHSFHFYFTSSPWHFRSAREWSLNADPEPEPNLWPGLDLAPPLLSSPTVTRAKPPKRRPPSNLFKFPVGIGIIVICS